jgi:hypothetical protein
MGWNNSRLDLLVPGWKIVPEEAPGTRTMKGTPLRILHVEQIKESGAFAIKLRRR